MTNAMLAWTWGHKCDACGDAVKEAVDAIIADIDSRYFFGKTDLDNEPLIDEEDQLFASEVGLAGIPVEKWSLTLFRWEDLYTHDVYGTRAEAEDYLTIWKDNWRAAANGIAIIQDIARPFRKNVDEDGNYQPPKPVHISGLDRFFPDNEDYADNVEEIETGRKTLLDSYYFLKGFNLAIDLIAAYFEIPDISVLKLPIDYIEDKIEALNNLVPILYDDIKHTTYEDKELQQKKLQVLQDIFPEIDYESVEIPAANIEKAKSYFEGFRAFKGNDFADTLLYRKNAINEGSECE